MPQPVMVAGARPPIGKRLCTLAPQSENGNITAGAASQLSDRAYAVAVTGAERAAELGLTPIAQIGACDTIAGPETSLLPQPANAIRDLGVSPGWVNLNGGAIALGHPAGMSGTRLALTLRVPAESAS